MTGTEFEPTQRLPGTPPLFSRAFTVLRAAFPRRRIAQLPQPFLKSLVTLSVEKSLARLDALALGDMSAVRRSST